MKKLAKTLCLALLIAAVAVAGAAFAACGGEEDEVPPGAEVYTFEAEYAALPSVGAGWSSGEAGVGADIDGEFNASNGYYVAGMYAKGSTLTFTITSDSDVTDARIVARLSTEDPASILKGPDGGKSFGITSDEFQVKVNGVATTYEEITFNNIKVTNKFKDYTVGTNVSLKKGENTIELVTNNDVSLGGTTEAKAPIVDCIKVTTAAKLTWEPDTSNLPE